MWGKWEDKESAEPVPKLGDPDMRYQEEHASARVPDETEQGRDSVSCEMVTKKKNTSMQTTDLLKYENKDPKTASGLPHFTKLNPKSFV